MNKLQLRADGRCASNTILRLVASNGGVRRARQTAVTTTHGGVSSTLRRAALRVRWVRNRATGRLECHWVTLGADEPPVSSSETRFDPILRMSRRTRRVGLRPPSRR